MYCFEMRTICSGMVAEKSRVCLPAGVSPRMVCMSSMKPMLSISSASSRTTVDTSERTRVFLRMWSSTRPGVPTTTSIPFFRLFICLSMDCPPYMGTETMPVFAPIWFISWATWMASSRVGTSTRAQGLLLLPLASFSTMGIPKAAVLPVPVWATPMMSLPFRRGGMAIFCIWVGSSNPMSDSECNTSSESPNS
jgi:hypothetical protein